MCAPCERGLKEKPDGGQGGNEVRPVRAGVEGTGNARR